MIEKDDLFTAEDKLYVVFDQFDFEGNNYCLCNEMVNEKTFGKKYVIFQNFDDGIEEVTDKDLLNRLIPIFTRNINLDYYNSEFVNMGEE